MELPIIQPLTIVGYNGYTPGTTKTIKSKPDKLSDMKDVDDGSEWYALGTYIYKVFNDIEYRGKVQGYNPHKKLYFIVYDDGDKEDYYHNEVRDYCADNVNQYPKRKRWRKRKSVALINLIQKYAPIEADTVEHVPTLSVEEMTSCKYYIYWCGYDWRYCTIRDD